ARETISMTAPDPNKPKSPSRRKAGLARRWPGVIVAIVLLAAIAAVIVLAMTAEEEEPTAYGPRAVPVALTEVAGMTLAETVRGVGTLRAAASVEVRPELAGRVRSIAFEEGAPVTEGQVLVEIDDEQLQRQRTSRQAALRAAEVRVHNA